VLEDLALLVLGEYTFSFPLVPGDALGLGIVGVGLCHFGL